jgi:predicted Fe-S protein YdhL (DUF1289 family)
MSEVKREPIIMPDPDNDGEVLECFDCNHSLADIARWIAKNEAEAEEVIALLQGILRGPVQ